MWVSQFDVGVGQLPPNLSCKTIFSYPNDSQHVSSQLCTNCLIIGISACAAWWKKEPPKFNNIIFLINKGKGNDNLGSLGIMQEEI